MLLAIIALAIIIINAAFYQKAYPYDLIFFFVSSFLAFLVKIESRVLLPLTILIFTTLVSLYDNDVFDIVLYEEPNSENIGKIKERTMVLMQICLLFTNNFSLNFVIVMINASLLITLKFEEFKKPEGILNPKELIYFMIYIIFYLFLLLKLKILSKNEDLMLQSLDSSKEHANFFKQFIKKHSKTPLIILRLDRKKKTSKQILSDKYRMRKSFTEPPSVQTKISIINDLNCLDQEYYLSMSFINNEAKELFRTDNNDDIDRLFREMIVFTEKIERTDGSNIKEKIGDLKEECFKIFNRLRLLSFSQDALPSNIVFDAEYKFRNSAENAHFLITCFPIMHNERINLMLSFNDISEKLEIERLKALDAYKDSIMANVTHDLRSPLQGLLACIDTFDQKGLNEQEALMVEIARSNIQMMSSLIQDILDDNQIKMGKIKLNLREFNTKEFAVDVTNFIKVLSKEHGVSVSSKISDFIPVILYSDQIRLKQVLVNLMNNSLKFTPKNGTITLEVTVHPKKPKYLCFCVRDTGNGIPQEIIDKLFKPYSTFQGKNGINSKGLLIYFIFLIVIDINIFHKIGIGLGLTICQNIVSLLGPYNRILCHSEMGKGTKFWFYVYTDQSQFESNLNSIKIRSSLEDSMNDSDKNGGFNYNLYSEFKISSNMNSENSKLMKTEEGSINEELDEYVDTLSSKRPFNIDSDQVINSPTACGNQVLLSKLVEFDLKSATVKSCIKPLLLDSPELRNSTSFKHPAISPPIEKKQLRKQLKLNGTLKPKTFEAIPTNFSAFRCKRGFSIGKRSPKNKTSIFVKDFPHSSISDFDSFDSIFTIFILGFCKAFNVMLSSFFFFPNISSNNLFPFFFL